MPLDCFTCYWKLFHLDAKSPSSTIRIYTGEHSNRIRSPQQPAGSSAGCEPVTLQLSQGSSPKHSSSPDAGEGAHCSRVVLPTKAEWAPLLFPGLMLCEPASQTTTRNLFMGWSPRRSHQRITGAFWHWRKNAFNRQKIWDVNSGWERQP